LLLRRHDTLLPFNFHRRADFSTTRKAPSGTPQ
jgi:hypothetical protein